MISTSYANARVKLKVPSLFLPYLEWKNFRGLEGGDKGPMRGDEHVNSNKV